MHVMDKPNAFIANRDKLYKTPELPDIVYDKVKKNEVLEVATIHQELRIPEVKGETMLVEEKTRKKSS